MSVIYVVSPNGDYLGAFADGALLDTDYQEVATPPEDARQRWLGDRWSDIPPTPDWVGFRRVFLTSEPWGAIASQTPYDWRVGAIMTAISLDSPDPVIVASLWNNLNKPLTGTQVQWISSAIAQFNIPFQIDNQGTITVVG